MMSTEINPAIMITLAEAAELWGISRTTIIWHYWHSQVHMRKSAGVWQVRLSDLVAMRGDPGESLQKVLSEFA